MTEVAKTVGSFIVEYYDVALAVIGVFAIIATKTPNKVDDKIGQLLMDAINFLAGNFGEAANKEKPNKEE